MRAHKYFKGDMNSRFLHVIVVLFMSAKLDVKKDMIELRERVVRLETKLEELTKRVDRLSKYTKDLYDYLQKR